jgi:predicted PurR-regulated permease PerM
MTTASAAERFVTRSRPGEVRVGATIEPYRTDVSDQSSGPPPPPLVRDLDWRSAAIAAVVLVGLIAVRDLAAATTQTLTFSAIALLLALALEPLVQAVERRLRARRSVAVGIVMAGFLASVIGLALLLGPAAVRQANDLQDELPDVIAELGDLPIVGDRLVENDVPERVQEWIEDLPARLAGDTAPIEGAARSILGGALAAMATLLLVVAILLDGARVVRGARNVLPSRHRERADRMAQVLYRVVGRYFAGSLLVAVIAGLTTLIVGTILSVPLTPLLAVNVALFDLVPQIGGAAGGLPFVALAFTESPTTGVLAAVFFVLYLQFENNVLAPIVVGDAVDLSPPATMIGALVGVSVAGVPGALVAIPSIGVAKAIYLELRPPPGVEPKDAYEEPDRPSALQRLIGVVLRRR